MSQIRQNLEALADGSGIRSDPHRNIQAYVNLSADKVKEVKELSRLLEDFSKVTMSPEQIEYLNSPHAPQAKKVEILTRAAMKVPFDYLGNAVKTAELMKAQKDSFIALEDTLKGKSFHFLRTPREVLEGFLEEGTGGDCFSTSFLAQALLSAYGIESKMALCYDNKGESSLEKKHHCVTLARADGKDLCVDTSLNVEVPVEFGKGTHDSRDKSSVFRLKLKKDGDQVDVGYVPERSLAKQGPVGYVKQFLSSAKRGFFHHLWYFDPKGNPLNEVLPSMLYTLHPSVPASRGNKLNRNQQLRITTFRERKDGKGRRERLLYHEAKGKYLSRPTEDRTQLATKVLSAGHDPQGKIAGEVGGFVKYVSDTFGVKPEAVYRSIEALDYINSGGKRK